MTKSHKTILTEQGPDALPLAIRVNIVSEGGQLWLQPEGYGEKCAAEGEGFPIGIEIWQGRLRLIIFDDITREDPQIIDLEKAKEDCRRYDKQCDKCQHACTDYCKAAEYIAEKGRQIFTGPMAGGLWNGRCLDAAIMSKKDCDKAAYEFLLKFGDRYARSLSDKEETVWLQLKEAAAAMLIPKT
jgi:hypothetical protein